MPPRQQPLALVPAEPPTHVESEAATESRTVAFSGALGIDTSARCIVASLRYVVDKPATPRAARALGVCGKPHVFLGRARNSCSSHQTCMPRHTGSSPRRTGHRGPDPDTNETNMRNVRSVQCLHWSALKHPLSIVRKVRLWMAEFPGKLLAEATAVGPRWLRSRRRTLRAATPVQNVKMCTITGGAWQTISSSYRDLDDFDTLCAQLPPDVATSPVIARMSRAARSHWAGDLGPTFLGAMLNELIHLDDTFGVLQLTVVRDFLGLDNALAVFEHARSRSGFEARAAAPELVDGFCLVATRHVARRAYSYDEFCVILWCPRTDQMYAVARRYTDFCNAMTAIEELQRRLPRCGSAGGEGAGTRLAPFPSKQPWWRSRAAVTTERIPQINAWLESVSAVPMLQHELVRAFLGKWDGHIH